MMSYHIISHILHITYQYVLCLMVHVYLWIYKFYFGCEGVLGELGQGSNAVLMELDMMYTRAEWEEMQAK